MTMSNPCASAALGAAEDEMLATQRGRSHRGAWRPPITSADNDIQDHRADTVAAESLARRQPPTQRELR